MMFVVQQKQRFIFAGFTGSKQLWFLEGRDDGKVTICGDDEWRFCQIMIFYSLSSGGKKIKTLRKCIICYLPNLSSHVGKIALRPQKSGEVRSNSCNVAYQMRICAQITFRSKLKILPRPTRKLPTFLFFPQHTRSWKKCTKIEIKGGKTRARFDRDNAPVSDFIGVPTLLLLPKSECLTSSVFLVSLAISRSRPTMPRIARA